MINTTSSLYAHNLSITEKENPWKRDDEDAIKQGCITLRCYGEYMNGKSTIAEKWQGRKHIFEVIIHYQIDFRILIHD